MKTREKVLTILLSLAIIAAYAIPALATDDGFEVLKDGVYFKTVESEDGNSANTVSCCGITFHKTPNSGNGSEFGIYMDKDGHINYDADSDFVLVATILFDKQEGTIELIVLEDVQFSFRWQSECGYAHFAVDGVGNYTIPSVRGLHFNNIWFGDGCMNGCPDCEEEDDGEDGKLEEDDDGEEPGDDDEDGKLEEDDDDKLDEDEDGKLEEDDDGDKPDETTNGDKPNDPWYYTPPTVTPSDDDTKTEDDDDDTKTEDDDDDTKTEDDDDTKTEDDDDDTKPGDDDDAGEPDNTLTDLYVYDPAVLGSFTGNMTESARVEMSDYDTSFDDYDEFDFAGLGDGVALGAFKNSPENDEPTVLGVTTMMDEAVDSINPDVPLTELPQTGVLNIYPIIFILGAILAGAGLVQKRRADNKAK